MKLPGEFPPKFSHLVRRANPLYDILSDARELIGSTRTEIRDLASAIGGRPLSTETADLKEVKSEEGTACLNCVRDHLSTVGSSLSEALRFARSGSMGDREVVRRLEIAEDEINIAERIDLHPSELEKLDKEEREVAEWLLPRLRDLRHQVQAIRVQGDLEKVSAKAFEVKNEFIRLLLQCKACGILSVEEFVKRRR